VIAGRMMTQPPTYSRALGCTVPRRTGRVVRVYLRAGDPRPLADLDTGHTVLAALLRRSNARQA
jgi:hypothetical protein